MTLKEDMANTVIGLSQRGSRWYVLIVIPPDLHKVYNKRRVNLSLGTSDRREATLLGTLKRAEWLADFEAKRHALHPTALASVSSKLSAYLVERVRAFVLEEDDRLRSDLPLLAEMVHVRKEFERKKASTLRIPQWTPAEARQDDLTGLTPEEAEELTGLNAYLDGNAAIALASMNLSVVLPLVQAEAGKLGVTLDAKTPGAREALLAALKAYRAAHRERALRDAGEIVETPVVLPPDTEVTGPRTLRTVYEKWQFSGDSIRSKDSIAAYGRAVTQFEGQYPSVSLEQITREQGDSYRTWLRANSKTPKTARDRLTAIKSLLKYAAETLEWIPKQPWRGIDIKAVTTNKRRPWTETELTTLFTSPLYTSYALPEARNAGGKAAYWIPLLGLYTGARLGELCQLRTVDVECHEGIHVLCLRDEGESQSIKTEAGVRQVPIHSELLRLGLLDYVESVRTTGNDSLWPALPLRKDKASDYFGRWFKDYRESLGMAGAGGASFHYFRHTVRPLMRRAGFSESTQDKITGHKTLGSIGTVTYDHWTREEMRKAIEAIQYPFLELRGNVPRSRDHRKSVASATA